jgi:hypothetical protein
MQSQKVEGYFENLVKIRCLPADFTTAQHGITNKKSQNVFI